MSESPSHPWLGRLIHSPLLDALCKRLGAASRESDDRAVIADGSCGSSTTLIAGALALRLRRPVLLAVGHLDDADDGVEDLALFEDVNLGGPLRVQRFGAMEVLPGESNVSLELLAERLSVIEQLGRAASASPVVSRKKITKKSASKRTKKKRKTVKESSAADRHTIKASPSPGRGLGGGAPDVLVAPIQALMQSAPDPTVLAEFQMPLNAGQRASSAQLFEWLDRAGYSRLDAVEQPGDFAIRGGIVDIYLPSSAGLELAASLDDPASGENARGGGGTGGTGGTGGAGQPVAVRLDFFGDEIESIRLIDLTTMGSGAAVHRVRLIGASAQRLQAEDRTVNVIDLMPDDTVVVLSEVMELAEQARGYFERLSDPRGIYAPQTVLKKLASFPHVQVSQFALSGKPDPDAMRVTVGQLPPFDRDAAKAVAELGAIVQPAAASESTDAPGATPGTGGDPPIADGPMQVIVLCQQQAELDRLLELIQEHTPATVEADSLTVELGYLHRGFVWEDDPQSPPLCIVPHHELFHRYMTRRQIRRVSGSPMSPDAKEPFLDLTPGDLVVHVEHGIAVFKGLRTMKRKGRQEDFLTLAFHGGALLHVPATQIDLIQKYVGAFEGRPQLSKLGGKRWEKQKEEARESVKALAGELLRIQAARSALPGMRYPEDSPWQQEFEAEFPYSETDDQLAAIAAISRDMHDEQPMDRLICGDVGFGKTEIAIRAAFRAVTAGKQAAVLVPTTVLAEQHEITFRQRMADYPFKVESLSRFKAKADQKLVLEAAREGKIDILIGTHRLLSKDVRFKELGLVIIDEEQRFGVEHKSKLLKLRMTVDVLTLSATPIPRTLHMAMLGLRDISSLSTPPADRRAVVTEVIPYDAGRIRDAINRELNRDGQVFFVHNRVLDIQSVANDVRNLAPRGARVIVGHGQMPATELEEVMLKFMRREADILVSTTIIESGIDIPTANTMIINDGDRFGLAQLHQLRGRVGRWKHRAYCYVLLPRDRPITDVAVRRLKAIEQFAMLGAGFKIAMRDLEIRGAGNLLGAEQSGHIAAVGYEMYCRMLEQEARRMRQEPVIEPVHTHLELPIPQEGMRFGAKYIPSMKHRMDAYKRLSQAFTHEQHDAVVKDLRDAYGDPPPAAQTLIDLAQLRVAAGLLHVESIKLEGADLIFRTPKPQLLEPALKGAPGRVTVVDESTVYYRPPTNYLSPPQTLLAVLRKLLVTGR